MAHELNKEFSKEKYEWTINTWKSVEPMLSMCQIICKIISLNAMLALARSMIDIRDIRMKTNRKSYSLLLHSYHIWNVFEMTMWQNPSCGNGLCASSLLIPVRLYFVKTKYMQNWTEVLNMQWCSYNFQPNTEGIWNFR
jgi:hypothetical protein